MIQPKNQINLYNLDIKLNELINLFKREKFPNKILLSGQKGLGKCTLAYHLINYILSIDEESPYDLDNFKINPNNKTFKLIQNNVHPNFNLIDIKDEKKNIDIEQIRKLINNLNKSSFNSKPRFILIDNIEYLNLNAINALLKTLEEPSTNTYFILINNNKDIISTLKSRCLDFKISLTNKKFLDTINKLINDDIHNKIDKELINYYSTPGNLYNFLLFSEENGIDLKKINLKNLIIFLIENNHYKNNPIINNMTYDLIELLLKISQLSMIIFLMYLNKKFIM